MTASIFIVADSIRMESKFHTLQREIQGIAVEGIISNMGRLKKPASGVLAMFPCSRTGSPLCAQK
jgi:hypothetical protein